MKIAICDDDAAFLTKLESLIMHTYSDSSKVYVSKFSSGEELLEEFSMSRFDVIILDIEMRELSGLKTAEQIRKTDSCVIIAFLTSHQEFAIEGYEVNAFRYMLKKQPEHIYKKQLQSMFDEYHQSHFTFDVHTSNSVYNVAVCDILYFEIFKRTVVLHTKNGDYQFNGKLSEIEKDERLVNFVKPHKSYYVNLLHIDSVESDAVIMKNNDRIPLSRNFKQEVTEKFASFLVLRC
ncbi:MAG: LytTR family DNA-binding domain-containing protein [Ruminococcus sp.]|nr:LytTR family DNA-binding domain-containing protein [Ruminococcus sp.]